LEQEARGPETPERFQILSLDGGGIRGVFSAAILAAIEEDLNVRLTDHFDLIAGTSTGGIIALGLGLGLRPADILAFYTAHGPHIFRNPLKLRSALWWFWRKYRSAALETGLRTVFSDRTFGESTKRLVIPSYNVGDDDVYIFRTAHAQRLRRDYRVPAWKIALATSAAPTYFPACRQVDGLRLIDGGVWANNPSMVAIIEAVGTLYVPADRIRLLSIGTYDAVVRRPRLLDRGGALAWARTAPDILLRSGSIAVNNQANYLLGKDKVLRIDPRVPAQEVTIDGVSALDSLIARARHQSRHVMPQVHARFVDHNAPPFVPFYKS
jgi:patatin-like phospholipase/acyl hydrolase